MSDELDKLIKYANSLRERGSPYAAMSHYALVELLTELQLARAVVKAARAWLTARTQGEAINKQIKMEEALKAFDSRSPK